MEKIKFYLSSVTLAAFGALTLGASSAQAAFFDSATQNPIAPLNKDLITLAGNMVNSILIIISVVAVLYLIYGGIQYITAGGDADKASKGRVTITNAIIGIVIILAAFAIYNFSVRLGNAA
jgi:heme/copper-type cytochrome/quinol oxidase subunit 2